MMINRHNLTCEWEGWSMDDYLREASSKLKALMSIIKHHIEDKDVPPLFYSRQDGAAVPAPTLEQPVALRKRKFIVFALYQLPRLVIKKVTDTLHCIHSTHPSWFKVFELHGLKYQEYDGAMAPKARNEALKAFEQDEDIVVLLMSNVGAVGLNITRASVVIFVVGLSDIW
jgi:SNF2 family DNA or RNA helicase